jgi:tRNA(Ile)-lysidine synthetase-like protein
VSSDLHEAIARVPAGGWAVGVSGGADSIALLALLRQRADLRLHVVHLDHQTRAESGEDAAFVATLANRWSLPCTVAARDQIESRIVDLPANPSARYRAARLELFRRVVAEHRLHGVILAHHADDQAETVMLRLLRGGGAAALCGMSETSSIGVLLVLRPLLQTPAEHLRKYLRSFGQPWREDASNLTGLYQRNRVRRILADRDRLRASLCDLSVAARGWRDWVVRHAPRLDEQFAVGQLADLSPPIAREAARAWLLARGAPPDDLPPVAVERLLNMATDASSPPRQQFPGNLLIRRRGRVISCQAAVT